MPVFVILRLCIGYTNHYMVASVMPVLDLLHPHIDHTNHYAVVAVMLTLFYSTSALVIPTAAW